MSERKSKPKEAAKLPRQAKKRVVRGKGEPHPDGFERFMKVLGSAVKPKK